MADIVKTTRSVRGTFGPALGVVPLSALVVLGGLWIASKHRVAAPRPAPNAVAQERAVSVPLHAAATATPVKARLGAAVASSSLVPKKPPLQSQTESSEDKDGVNREMLDRLQARLSEGARDVAEERNLRGQLSTALSTNLPSTTVKSVECSMAICRVDLTSTAGKVEGETVMDQMTRRGPHGGIVISTKEALVGEHAAVIYVGRYGQPLPIFAEG